MYQILCDNNLIYDLRDESLTAVDPVLTLEVNSAGSLTFTFMPDHPYYDKYTKLKSVITVLQDGAEIWSGRVLTDKVDFFKRKTVTCEGELAYLNDSIQRPGEYHDITVRQFLELMVSSHNTQVDASRQFVVGSVTVADSNNSLYRYLNYESTYEDIKTKLMDRLGGFLFVRKEGGVRYLDYLKDYPGSVNQVIEFGENLLDFSSNYDASTVATAIIPLGAKVEETQFTSIEERLTIKSVNNNVDYVQDDAAVAHYGRIFAVETWDDVTTASALLAKGKEYLASGQWENMTLECTAIDLNLTDKDFQSLKVGYTAPVKSPPHGMDAIFPVAKKVINFEAPQNDTVTFSYVAIVSMTSLAEKGNSDLTEKVEGVYGSALAGAKANATALINSSLHGYVVMNDADNDGTPDEILIMDSADTKTATKVWRWNSNGLGYSSTGYAGSYGLAMTKDGAIVADFITAGKLTANIIKSGKIASSDGTTYFDLDKNRLISEDDNYKTSLYNSHISITRDENQRAILYASVSDNDVGVLRLTSANGNTMYLSADGLYFNTEGSGGKWGNIETTGYIKSSHITANGNITATGNIEGANIYSDGAVNADKSFSLNDASGGIYCGGIGYTGFSWKSIKTADGSNAMVLCRVY